MRPTRHSLCAALAGVGTAVIASNCTSALAAPGDRIGVAMLIENLVTADYARDTRTLRVGDGVRQEEHIEVALDARSEFDLNDDTKLALGPGSKVTLDRFVFDPDTATGSIILNMAKGTMRWVTGVANKPSYVIRTPNASITVRGTIFDLFLTETNETWLLLHEGAVQVCNASGQCKVHTETCKLTRVSDAGDVSGATSWSKVPGAKDNMFHRAFPFVVLPPEVATGPACTRDAIMNQRDANSTPSEPKVRKAEVEPVYKPTYAEDEPEPRVTKRVKPARQASYEPVREKKTEVREAKARSESRVREAQARGQGRV